MHTTALRSLAGVAGAVCLFFVSSGAHGAFVVNSLTSDGVVPANNFNANLNNPWGMAYGPGGPLRVTETNSGQSEKFDGTGVDHGLPYTNVVTIPPENLGSPNTGPTGVAYNQTLVSGSTPGFLVGGMPATFLFASLDGDVYAWSMNSGTAVATPEISNTGTSVYTGLTVGTNGLLYVADVKNGAVAVFNKAYQPATTTGNFVDPSLPSGWRPYNIQQVGSMLVVTYTSMQNRVAGGYVDEFDLQGNFIRRLSAPNLDNPWGIDVAPASWGAYGGDLLIGNFGNGEIDAFNLVSGLFEGTLDGTSGAPLQIPGLFALVTGNGSNHESPNAVYFTAGIDLKNPPIDGTGGLFGDIAVPEPASISMFAFGVSAAAWLRRLTRRRSVATGRARAT